MRQEERTVCPRLKRAKSLSRCTRAILGEADVRIREELEGGDANTRNLYGALLPVDFIHGVDERRGATSATRNDTTVPDSESFTNPLYA